MPRVGSSKNRISQSRSEPFRDHDLLLVAARQEADLLSIRWRLDPQPRDVGARRLADGTRLQKHLHGQKAAQARHHDISRHVHAGRQAEVLPVLGEIADAEPHGILRRPDRHGLALDDDLAAIQRIRAENRPCDLRPPRTHQTGEAEDLSSSQLEADIPDGVAAPKVADLEHHLVTRQVRNFRLRLRQAAADHHRDDRVDARRRGGDSADILAVAHHGDTVRDLLQLVHLVRDIDDADAFDL